MFIRNKKKTAYLLQWYNNNIMFGSISNQRIEELNKYCLQCNECTHYLGLHVYTCTLLII